MARAAAAGLRRAGRVFDAADLGEPLPVVLIYLQYVWAELGQDGTWAYGLGVHAASALLLFGTTTALFVAALRAAPPRARSEATKA